MWGYIYLLSFTSIVVILGLIFMEVCKIKTKIEQLYNNIDFQFTDDQEEDENDENRK